MTIKVIGIEYARGDVSITYKQGPSSTTIVDYKETMRELVGALKEDLTEFYDLGYTVTVCHAKIQANAVIEKIEALLKDGSAFDKAEHIDLVMLYRDLETMRSVVKRTAYMEKICQRRENGV